MKWEYKLTCIEAGHSIPEFLNQHGKAGWELIHCNIQKNNYIFKRPDIAAMETELKKALEKIEWRKREHEIK